MLRKTKIRVFFLCVIGFLSFVIFPDTKMMNLVPLTGLIIAPYATSSLAASSTKSTLSSFTPCWPDFAPITARSSVLGSETMPSGRIALLSMFALRQESLDDSLSVWHNYWAQSCAGQATVADCILVIVSPGKDIDLLPLRQPPSSLETTGPSSYCGWRAHWENTGNGSLGAKRLSARTAARVFAQRNADDALPDNVILLHISGEELDHRLRDVAQVGDDFLSWESKATFMAMSPLKFADMKPLYGALFPDLVQSDDFVYSHWAFADIDMLYGDLSAFLFIKPRYDPDEINNPTPDVQTVYFLDPNGYTMPTVSGQLTVFKNEPRMSELWRTMSRRDGFDVLRIPDYTAFDERPFGIHVFEEVGYEGMTARVLRGSFDSNCRSWWDWDVRWDAPLEFTSPAHLTIHRNCIDSNLPSAHPTCGSVTNETREVALLHFGCTKDLIVKRNSLNKVTAAATTATATTATATGTANAVVADDRFCEHCANGIWPKNGWYQKAYTYTSFLNNSGVPFWSFHDPNWGTHRLKDVCNKPVEEWFNIGLIIRNFNWTQSWRNFEVKVGIKSFGCLCGADPYCNVL